MDLIQNIGLRVTDRITGITGNISGVFFGAGENPQYKLEFVDKNGAGNTIWCAVDRVDFGGFHFGDDEE